MIFKDFFIDGKKVKDLYVNAKKVKIGGAEPVPEDMLGFKAVDGSVGLRLAKNGTPDAVSLETRLDDGSWNAWDLSEITIPQNSTLYVRRTDDNPSNIFSTNVAYYYKFVTSGTGKLQASGNIQYLLGKSGTRTDVPTQCYVNMFNGCTSLTQAPQLPATTLAGGSYTYMFQGCTSLTTTPDLPATTLATTCYYSMFNGCTSLTQAPQLPATTLAPQCYSMMFQGCTSLTQAPQLPATTLGNQCYGQMFQGCTSLTQAPELPATTLASFSYSAMFRDCTSLVKAPELPATTLGSQCYQNMFRGCTSLVKAPELPATTLVTGCYADMFRECTSLNSMKVSFTSWSSYTERWFYDGSTTGTFICPQALIDATTTRTTSTVPSGWTMEADDITTFKAVGGSASVRMTKTGTPNVTPEFEVSKNYGAWTTWDKDWINLNDGESFRIRATTSTGPKTSQDFYHYWHFESSGDGNIECAGDLMYLFSKDKSVTSLPGAQNLFNGMTKLTKVQLCSANTLALYSAGQMFNNCTGLTDGPEFYVTESGVSTSSLLQAFVNCTSLRKVKFTNCSMNFVTNTIAGTNAAFLNAAANIEVVCSDGTIYVNDT